MHGNDADVLYTHVAGPVMDAGSKIVEVMTEPFLATSESFAHLVIVWFEWGMSV